MYIHELTLSADNDLLVFGGNATDDFSPLSRSKMRALESQLAFIAQSLLSLHGARIHAHTHKPHSANSLASRPLPSSVPCVLAQIPLGDNN